MPCLAGSDIGLRRRSVSSETSNHVKVSRSWFGGPYIVTAPNIAYGRLAQPCYIRTLSYAMHRIFCATSDDMEAERQAFYDAIGSFNEKSAMARGVLFVPVSIPVNMPDKRPFQPVVDENIRSSRYYVQVFGNSAWPEHRNFARDYALALDCASDSASPMCEVAALVRHTPDAANPDATVYLAHRVLQYASPEEFTRHCQELLGGWLQSVACQ